MTIRGHFTRQSRVFYMASWQLCCCPKAIGGHVGVLNSYVNTFFCSYKFAWLIATWVKTPYKISDFYLGINLSLGDGSYIYIDTSHPRNYDEKARLNSPWMRGAQRMTFYYSMYGSTVESLSVYVRINGSEARIWSRYRSHVSRDWIEACLTINYAGMYRV